MAHGTLEEKYCEDEDKMVNVKYIGLPIPKGTESVNESIAVVFRTYARYER